MIKDSQNLKIPQPFLIKGKGVVYGVDIGNGYVSFYDLNSQNIEIKKYDSTSKELGSFDKKSQLIGFEEYNLSSFPQQGKSNFKVDGYCEFGNFLLFEITNKKVKSGIEIILRTYQGIDSDLVSDKFPKIKHNESNLSRGSFQAYSDVGQYLTGIVDTPNSIEELKDLLYLKNLKFVK